MLDYFRKVCGRGSGAVQGGSGAVHFGQVPSVVDTGVECPRYVVVPSMLLCSQTLCGTGLPVLSFDGSLQSPKQETPLEATGLERASSTSSTKTPEL